MKRLRLLIGFVFLAWVALLALAGMAQAAEGASPGDAADGAEPAPPVAGDPVTMTVGVVVTELTKFDLASGTYNAELFALVHCDREPCKPDLDVANGKLTGKPEKLHDEPLFKIFKLKAELSAVIDLSNYPFDSHALPIVLEDKGDPEGIRYALDREHSAL